MRVFLVHDVDVDPVGAETPQTLVHRPQDVPARQPRLGQRFTGAEADFGGDHHLLPARLQRGTEQLLGLPARIAVRRIEERNAGIERLAHQLLGELPAYFENRADVFVTGGECHRPEGEP